VDTLLAKGITPYPTLFHYDLPQPLQDAGGWPKRETAQRFGDYARVVGERLGDRVTRWITHNEPWVTAFLGYFTGEHAPGHRKPQAAFAAAHHLLLSHGYAVQALRASSRQPTQIGIALNLSPTYPASPTSRWDAKAVALTDGWINRLFLDPILKGRYPDDYTTSILWRWMERGLYRSIQGDDLKIISPPLDFVGVNYYTRGVVRYAPLIEAMQIRPSGSEYSEMWEIYPPGLYDLLMRLHKDYGHPNLVVTENGIPVPDRVDADGHVHDPHRIRYLSAHLAQVHRAIAAGVPVTGYFVWSMLDNFEWVHGYTKRFGLVYVDFDTQARIAKDSARWFGQVIRENGLTSV
jgi:beta-glucosidase